MGIFGSIMSKLGFGDNEAEQAAPVAPTAAPVPKPAAAPVVASTPAAAPIPAAPAAVKPVIDVHTKLSQLASTSTEKLNWEVSIVDLLKLLDIDSSLAARKELATELKCPADKMADSAAMNIWLHKTVLQQLAANGGNVPAHLLD